MRRGAPTRMGMRAVVAALLLVLAVAVPADAKLRPVGKLKAKPGASTVRLTWKDRSRGETRYVVRRAGRKVRLKKNRRRFVDRRVKPATRYRYSVRACKRKRCAKVRRVTVRTKAPGAAPAPGAGGGGGDGSFAGSPTIGGCPIFPNDNPWNTDVSNVPGRHLARLHRLARLDDAVARLRRRRRSTASPTSASRSPSRSCRSPSRSPTSPIPARTRSRPTRRSRTAAIATCSRCARATASCSSCSPPSAQGTAGTRTAARSGTCESNALRPERWTSADAAGLPILPGLARRDEADSGVIRHALRITVPVTQKAYIHPATHWASDNTDTNQPPMGLRVRLKASYDISGLRGQARAVAQALKTYGALVADNAGSSRVYVGGAVDPGWDDEALNGIKTIPASALEAVQTGPVVRP